MLIKGKNTNKQLKTSFPLFLIKNAWTAPATAWRKSLVWNTEGDDWKLQGNILFFWDKAEDFITLFKNPPPATGFGCTCVGFSSVSSCDLSSLCVIPPILLKEKIRKICLWPMCAPYLHSLTPAQKLIFPWRKSQTLVGLPPTGKPWFPRDQSYQFRERASKPRNVKQTKSTLLPPPITQISLQIWLFFLLFFCHMPQHAGS